MSSDVFNCEATMYPSEIWFECFAGCKGLHFRREHGAPAQKNRDDIWIHWISTLTVSHVPEKG
jgi:hypothetical protein